MLVAAVVSLIELFPLDSELQTLGFAWFLIYLQVILLFQRKDERKYWLLVMLSLLQVVVATLFNQGVLFGVLLASLHVAGLLGDDVAAVASAVEAPSSAARGGGRGFNATQPRLASLAVGLRARPRLVGVARRQRPCRPGGPLLAAIGADGTYCTLGLTSGLVLCRAAVQSDHWRARRPNRSPWSATPTR